MNRRVACVLVSSCAAAALYAQDFKAYQNYDFMPGDKIIFEDDFRADTDDEFPARWKLVSGQAVVHKFEGEPAFTLTNGNYARVAPRLTSDGYLSDPFTVEFDFFAVNGPDAFRHFIVFLKNDDDEKTVTFGFETSTGGLEHDLGGRLPGDESEFLQKWHHVALVHANHQLKCYLDQYRTLVVPDFPFVPKSVGFGGIASEDEPLIFKDVVVATGGGMNLVDKLAKDGKILTHGISFDVNQATLKPPSMATISEMVTLLKDQPSLKLEIGSHTDSAGDAARSLTLSQARANAVKKALTDAGIDAARLTTKGYGATRPVDDNATPEGRANNRRVEFTKIG